MEEGPLRMHYYYLPIQQIFIYKTVLHMVSLLIGVSGENQVLPCSGFCGPFQVLFFIYLYLWEVFLNISVFLTFL